MKILYHIIDFVFPPSAEELKLRTFSCKSFFKEIPRASATEFPFIESVFSYKNPLVKELIWQIKYKKNRHTIHLAAHALLQNLSKLPQSALLVPIPISKKRRKERGYNQCELLIDEILRLDTENKFQKDFELLTRSKHIEKQTHKDRNERLENTKGIFRTTCKENLQRKIIIVDDVSTTGSTLKEARDELLSTGYSDVTALTVAH